MRRLLCLCLFLGACEDKGLQKVDECAWLRWNAALMVVQVPLEPIWKQCYREIVGE